MSKLLYLLIALFLIQTNVNATDFFSSIQKNINEPISDAEGNLRNKKLFNTSFGAIYQLTTFEHNLTGNDLGINFRVWGINNHLLSTNNSMGINGQFTLNITGKTWLQIASEGVWSIATPYDSSVRGITSYLSYSNYEVKAVVGYDLLSYSFVDWSVYGGLFHKGISYDNTNIYHNLVITLPGSGFVIFNGYGSTATTTTIKFTGAVLGNGLTFYTQNTVSNVYLEGYITSLYFTDNISAANHNGVFNAASLTNNDGLSGGFGAGASTEIKIMDCGMWIKPSVKYQMLFNNINGYQPVINFTNFQTLTLGIALSWR